MAVAPEKVLSRWRTGKLIGDAQHVLVVRVRRGHLRKDYMASRRIDHLGADGLGSPIFPPMIWKGVNHDCYQGLWVADGPWVTLPNIQSAKWTKSFQDKGISSCTVVMDNLAFPDTMGAGGLYHTIERGYFSPSRGVTVTARPKLWSSTGWTNVLNGGYQIELWEGYGAGDEVVPLDEPDADTHSCAPPGAAIARTWTGIIEDCETESSPDQITITARDFGMIFTDQRLMGWNKAREIQSPITFADYKRTMGEQKLSGPYAVSSGRPTGHAWTSRGTDSSDDFEWVEITLPAGHYSEFFLSPRFGNQEMWLSLYLNGAGTMDRTERHARGWVDLGSGEVNGTPFMRHWKTVDTKPRRWDMGHFWQVPNNSKLRLTFSRLKAQQGKFYTGFKDCAAYRFGTDPNHPPDGSPGVNAKHWVLVQDVAEVVRMLIIWAGFKEWYVEDFGWSLVAPMRFGEDKFFIDVFDEVLAQGNYVFHMGSPTNDDRSIGVPHFEHQKATDAPRADLLDVRDDNMAETAQEKWDLSNLPYVLRYRGEVDDSGHALFQDRVKRFMSSYYPPWSGEHYMRIGTSIFRPGHESQALNRVASIGRHFTATLGQGTTAGLKSDVECLFACILASIQYALGMCTGQVQVAGLPGVELNTQISVVDLGAGINSRMWVGSIESNHTLGRDGKWTMVIGGSYIDTPDMASIAQDYAWAYEEALTFRPPTSEGSWAQGPAGADTRA